MPDAPRHPSSPPISEAAAAAAPAGNGARSAAPARKADGKADRPGKSAKAKPAAQARTAAAKTEQAGASEAGSGAAEADKGRELGLAPPMTQAQLQALRRSKGRKPKPPGPVPEPRGPVPEAVRTLWPAYFDDDLPEDAPLSRSLPVRGTPLEPFAEATIPGPAGPTWAGRHRKPIAHFRALEPEFGGSTRLAHLLACCVVLLRREPDNARARHLFQRITARKGDSVAPAMNLRWLTSVCDTFMDVAESPLDRSLAMTGTLMANTIKIAETERRMFTPPRPWPPKASFIRGGHLFDGVIAYWVGNGDMIENMLDRVRRTLPPESPVTPFVREVIERCFTQDTTLGRILSLQDGRTFPLASDPQIAAARRAMRDL